MIEPEIKEVYDQTGNQPTISTYQHRPSNPNIETFSVINCENTNDKHARSHVSMRQKTRAELLNSLSCFNRLAKRGLYPMTIEQVQDTYLELLKIEIRLKKVTSEDELERVDQLYDTTIEMIESNQRRQMDCSETKDDDQTKSTEKKVEPVMSPLIVVDSFEPDTRKGSERNNGEIEIEKEVEDEDNETVDNHDSDENGDGIEDNLDEESSRLVVNPPMDTTPSHPIEQVVIRQCSTLTKGKQTEKEEQTKWTNEVDNQKVVVEEEVTSPPVNQPRQSQPTTLNSTKQIITHTLQCPQCDEMLTPDKFAKHMNVHSIGPFRCAVKDCRQSFVNSRILSDHLAQSHQSTSQWHCGKCDHHYPSYKHLSIHNQQHHQLGHFECSFPACTFTGECKSKVFTHYAAQHRQIIKRKKKCLHPGCQYETAKSNNLKQHQRAHLGIKPYKCKWCHCDYAATKRSTVVSHCLLRCH